MDQQMAAARLAERVKLELAEHLEDADRHAGRYVDEYVEAMLSRRPRRPHNKRLHPKVAELIRELALDASAGDAILRRR